METKEETRNRENNLGDLCWELQKKKKKDESLSQNKERRVKYFRSKRTDQTLNVKNENRLSMRDLAQF